MSHVATIEIEIKDLAALKQAAADLGLEFREGQKTCRRHSLVLGDIPAGFTKDEMSRCEHAISPGDEKLTYQEGPLAGRTYPVQPYEIGVSKRRDGKPGYILMWDDYCRGFGLMDKVGQNAQKLVQRYAVNVAKRAAAKQGYHCKEIAQKDGTIQLEATRRPGR